MNVGPAFWSQGSAIPSAVWREDGPGLLSNSDRTFLWEPVGSSLQCCYVVGTAARTGKRYWEVVVDGPTARGYHIGLIAQAEWVSGTPGDYPDNPYGGMSYLICNGNTLGMTVGLLTNGTASANVSYDFTISNVIGVAVDFDTLKVWFSINGTYVSGDPEAGTSPTFTLPNAAFDPYVSLYGAAASLQLTGNFSTNSFVTPAPSGFISLTSP